jgi:hypothetical protein
MKKSVAWYNVEGKILKSSTGAERNNGDESRGWTLFLRN